ncbi:Ras association domain-containing protein 1 [Armadillidium vulgare]|nr:Ras association domain-containing protein 1 [Armadillidium vulgare]
MQILFQETNKLLCNLCLPKLRRLGDNECPLVLAIAWSAEDITNKRLVLQENDTADIQWEAFSLPELDNFLRILEREEGEYKNQIRDKYSHLRQRLQWQLSRLSAMETC